MACNAQQRFPLPRGVELHTARFASILFERANNPTPQGLVLRAVPSPHNVVGIAGLLCWSCIWEIVSQASRSRCRLHASICSVQQYLIASLNLHQSAIF